MYNSIWSRECNETTLVKVPAHVSNVIARDGREARWPRPPPTTMHMLHCRASIPSRGSIKSTLGGSRYWQHKNCRRRLRIDIIRSEIGKSLVAYPSTSRVQFRSLQTISATVPCHCHELKDDLCSLLAVLCDGHGASLAGIFGFLVART